MQRIHLLVLALPALLIGCGSSIDDLRSGIPNSDTVRMSVPRPAGQALEVGTVQQGARGDTARYYLITRGVTELVNGGTGLVLLLVQAITDNPPTSFNGHVAVWGPYTEPLHANTYRFTATDQGNHHYSYALEGKAKWDPDSAYVALLSGTHTAVVDSRGKAIRGFGNGSFLIDWDKAYSLPDHRDDVGRGEFTYSRMSLTAQLEIGVTLTQVRDADTGQRVDARYNYLSVPGADGMFRFSTFSNQGGTLTRFSIESRWRNNGAGRSDVLVINPLQMQQATVNECWDQFFRSQYFHTSYDPSLNYGSEADCGFSPAEYSSL